MTSFKNNHHEEYAMLTVHTSKSITDLKKEIDVKDIVIPVAVDNIRENSYFLSICKEYPELNQKFDELYSGKTLIPGNVFIIPVNEECRVILLVIKTVDRYGAALVDILDCLDQLISLENKFFIKKIVIPVIDFKTSRLADSLAIQPIIDYLSYSAIDVHLMDEEDKLKYFIIDIMTLQGKSIVSWKINPLKETRMSSKDDILVMIVLKDLFTRLSRYKMSKSSLVRFYKVFKDNGYFKEVEFYKTDHGEFFKEFMMKMSFMVNHGILFNAMRGVDPTKMTLVLGNNISHFETAAKDIIDQLGVDRYRMYLILKNDWKEALKKMSQRDWAAKNNSGNNNSNNYSKAPANNDDPFSGF